MNRVNTNHKIFDIMTNQEVKDENKFWADKFDIPVEDVVWGQHGICYGSIVVKTKKSAEKVSEKVRASGATANGGFMHGMKLGGITANNDGTFRITH